ncbi:MAG: hypothetical protein CSA42_07605 [Gammaproteobacteria bacterium]|nr:MAG: hypothetical protein CSA42_07605 [Gammaproteobacteria bacterium]
MAIISFPFGMIAGAICDLFLTTISFFPRKANVIFIWLSMVILGGWQWFFFLPAMYNFLRKKTRNRKKI